MTAQPETDPPWRAIDTILDIVQPAEFLFADGAVVAGEWKPYWCGSDCPCYPLDEGPSEFQDSYPSCWCVWTGDLSFTTEPTHWRPRQA